MSVRRVVLVGIGVCWLVSLALPAIRVAGGPLLNGADILARGWQGAGAGVYAWYSNPLFLLALLLGSLGRLRSAGVLSGGAFLLGLTTLAMGPLAAESGIAIPAVSLQIGFYLWLGAQLALLVWSWSWVAVELRANDSH